MALVCRLLLSDMFNEKTKPHLTNIVQCCVFTRHPHSVSIDCICDWVECFRTAIEPGCPAVNRKSIGVILKRLVEEGVLFKTKAPGSKALYAAITKAQNSKLFGGGGAIAPLEPPLDPDVLMDT